MTNPRDEDLLIADLDQENRMMRARNKRLKAELAQARSNAIEEVANAVEQFAFPFGTDTTSSFAVFIRSLKEKNT